jgi:hypothetical protein
VKTQGLHSIKDIYSKGAFAAILLLGFFTFSGNAVSFQNRQDSAPITWVVSGNAYKVNEFKYPAQSFKVYKQKVVDLVSLRILNLSLIHSKQVSISLKIHSAITSFKTAAPIFYRGKTISQNGKNEPSII